MSLYRHVVYNMSRYVVKLTELGTSWLGSDRNFELYQAYYNDFALKHKIILWVAVRRCDSNNFPQHKVL